MVRHGTDHVRRGDFRHARETERQSHDLAGVQRLQIQLVNDDDDVRETGARDGEKQQRHRQNTTAAGIAGENEQTRGQQEPGREEQLSHDGRRQSAGSAQPVGQPAGRDHERGRRQERHG